MDVAQELKPLMLREPRLTLAVAESISCGRLQAVIGAVSGASEFFLGGLTAYTIPQKMRHLGVDRMHAEAVNAVSPEVAAEMARGAATFFGSDVGLATTGYAEPAPAFGATQPMGYWALAHRRADNTWAMREGREEWPGAERVAMQQAVAEAAAAGLIRYLYELRGLSAHPWIIGQTPGGTKSTSR